MEFKEILGRQYEKKCLVGEFSISYFVFIDVYNMFVHEFLFLMFCVLNIISEVMNVEPLKYLIQQENVQLS